MLVAHDQNKEKILFQQFCLPLLCEIQCFTIIKQSCDEELKIDELKQYDQRQVLQGVPETPHEDVAQITLDLAKSLDIEVDNRCIPLK